MKRSILSLVLVACGLVACAVSLHAQTPTDAVSLDTVDDAATGRPSYSLYVDGSIAIGTLGRGIARSGSIGFGARGGIAVVEVHLGKHGGTASTNEQVYLGGASIPLWRSSTLELLGGVSVMDGYAEGRLLYSEYRRNFWELIGLGHGPGDWIKHYEHHDLGTGPAIRFAVTGMMWDVTRICLSFNARTEFKPNTTQLAGAVSVQLGAF